MGYYVTYEGTIDIPENKNDDILEALKELNHRHDIKSGGKWPKTGNPYEDEWFSWMPSRYHETVKSVNDVLELLGFYVYDENRVTYDSKIGDEIYFLETIVKNGGTVELEARGEDGHMWRYKTVDGKLVEQTGRVVYD